MENNQKEQEQINHLLDNGFEIKTMLFGKVKTWRTKKMSLGRLIELSNVFLKMKINTEVFDKGDFNEMLTEQYNVVHDNALNCAKVIAICVTDKKWLRPFLTKHFLKNINASELLEVSKGLIKQGDYQNFILSIGLMNGNRLTKATPIEGMV